MPAETVRPVAQPLAGNSQSLRHALAEALVEPAGGCLVLGADRQPLLRSDGRPLRLNVADAVTQARPGFAPMGTPRPDVLAIDLDATEQPDHVPAFNAVAAELRRSGYTPIITASGRPGHRHLWCVIEDQADRERLTNLARAYRLSVRTNQPMQLPLGPHAEGLPVALVSPTTADAALRAVQRQGPPPSRLIPSPRTGEHDALRRWRPLSPEYAALLRTGDGPLAPRKVDGQVDRSKVEWRLAVAAANAGWTVSDWVAAILDPTNRGGLKSQLRQDSDAYAQRRFEEAAAFVNANPPIASRKAVEAQVTGWLNAVHAHAWNYRVRASTLRVATALGQIAIDACRLDPAVSVRQVQEGAGISGFGTAYEALQRLQGHHDRNGPRFLRVAARAAPADPSGKSKTRWALIAPDTVDSDGVLPGSLSTWGVLRLNDPTGSPSTLTLPPSHDVWRSRWTDPDGRVRHGLGPGGWRTACALDPTIPRSVGDVAARAQFKTTKTVRDHLHRLASVGLAVCIGRDWLLGPRAADLDVIATELGVAGAQRRLRERHERHRAG